MQRRSAVVLTALVMVLGAGSVTAQEVGSPVPVVDPEGVVHGSITVKEVADPFTGNDPAAPPPEGNRYVALTVTYEAAPDQSLDAQPYQVVLQDSDGRFYPPQFVARPADSQMPDLQSQLMAPDNRISGLITYIVPAAVTVDKVVLSPTWDRITDIADLSPGDTPALGDAVSYTDAAGGTATISASIVDPFTDNDPAYPPAEGTRFVMVQPVFENSGAVPYFADPYDVYLRDHTGLLVAPATVYRPPEISIPNLEAQTMSPGDRVSGYVGFQVGADVQVTDVLYSPETGRMVPIAHLGGAGAAPADGAPADASPAPAASAAADG